MKITDAFVLKEIKRISDGWLDDDIKSYPDDEREGRTDIEFFTDEISYAVSLYHEDGHDWNEGRKEAEELLKETNNGKTIPCDSSFRPKPGYEPWRIEQAKRVVAMYRTYVRELKKLQKMGHFGNWYTI